MLTPAPKRRVAKRRSRDQVLLSLPPRSIWRPRRSIACYWLAGLTLAGLSGQATKAAAPPAAPSPTATTPQTAKQETAKQETAKAACQSDRDDPARTNRVPLLLPEDRELPDSISVEPDGETLHVIRGIVEGQYSKPLSHPVLGEIQALIQASGGSVVGKSELLQESEFLHESDKPQIPRRKSQPRLIQQPPSVTVNQITEKKLAVRKRVRLAETLLKSARLLETLGGTEGGNLDTRRANLVNEMRREAVRLLNRSVSIPAKAATVSVPFRPGKSAPLPRPHDASPPGEHASSDWRLPSGTDGEGHDKRTPPAGDQQ